MASPKKGNRLIKSLIKLKTCAHKKTGVYTEQYQTSSHPRPSFDFNVVTEKHFQSQGSFVHSF